jgi:hypothetical protein
MTPPALAARYFAMALVFGGGLGLIYGFLRPLRQVRTHFADGLFLLAAFWAWVWHGFGICHGQLRFGYTVGLILGALGWEWSIGRILRPVWQQFWHFVALFFRPLGKIFGFFRKNCKKVFAFSKK